MDLERKRMECPFTWGIEKQWAKNFDEMNEPIINFDEEPLLAFVSSIMITYIRAEKGNYQEASTNLKTTDDIWKKLDKSELETIGVSTKVLLHIKIATEYFICDLLKQKGEAGHLLKSLVSADSFQTTFEEATIKGCKSVAWASFHEAGEKKAQEYARVATLNSPNCPLWHYILGKSLRHSRREIYGNLEPFGEEQDAFIKSCKLSNASFYKIHLAQMYRENRDYLKSHDICMEIFQTKPKSFGILLKLAAGFMYVFNDFERAKKCLDEAGKQSQNTVYHHSMGVFYAKQKKHELAVVHYELAAMKGKNYKADMQHAHSLHRLDKNYDLIQHLEKMLVKYDEFINYKQQIFLHIAMQYYFRKIDIKKSLAYFLQAIELQPESQQLMKFFNSSIDWVVYNIYDFTNKILQSYEWHPSTSSIVKCDDVKKLEEYCKQYEETQLSKSVDKIQLCKM